MTKRLYYNDKKINQLYDVIAVNREDKLAKLNNGEIIHITNFIDKDGNETTDAFSAVSCVAKKNERNWFSINLKDFE